ncbi:MAG: glycosyltransferase family 2 protein [Bacteroidetes bacterium]|nr:glycosyltransferase family 2 protein [Bacteroidota bacterium]
MDKKVAVLLVVTNEAHHMKTHFNSLKNQTYKNISVYVTDNNSKDNSVELIRELYPEANINSFSENTGFARGNNIAAKHAYDDGADYLFILNPDIELDPECIEQLVLFSEQNKQIGLVAPVMFYGLEKKSKNIIQSYDDHVNFYTSGSHSPHAELVFNADTIPVIIETSMTGGGITFMKREVYQKIGLFEESYFIYNDEIDLAYRVKKAGYKMFATHRAKVWHHHNWSQKNKIQHRLMYYYMTRNRFLYFKQYHLYSYLLYNIMLEIFLMPLKIRWALRTSDLRFLRFYYLGIVRGIAGEKGETNRSFE